MTDLNIEELVRKAQKSRKKKTLELFMDEHFEELEAEIQKKPGWPTLMIVFQKLDLKNAWGNKLAVGTVRRTWHRVCKSRSLKAQIPVPKNEIVHILRPKQDPVSHEARASQRHLERMDAETRVASSHATSEIDRAISRSRQRSLPMPTRIEKRSSSDS
ncbi:MAG: hypothetical protein ABF562_02745 [Gluconobacter japonicus]|uniref:hypothetical protein n=1 Tax=Gluconobacter japonicus TaxID=376620 RepID=UPI0039EA53E0